ncbi:MAG: rhodanese-like domain-containing protein [Clostridia bacterium]|nr:rhodanese-like domain-containing protein [Clostridia bacterium]MDD4375599.1 rhodanese-like domain-containing protein [Clostridia bacterium]
MENNSFNNIIKNGQNILSQLGNITGLNRNRRNYNYNRSSTRILSMEDAYMQIKAGSCNIIDVRTENEYKVMRIKGAINVPLAMIRENITNIIPNKSACIMVYCTTGTRTAQAVQLLKNMGYTNLIIWEGGGINNFKYKDVIEKLTDEMNNEKV